MAEYNVSGVFNGSNAPAAGTPTKEYGYRSGQMLVVFDSTQTGDDQLKWLVTDHLGSTRMLVNRSGSLTGMKRRDYLPFGEELAATVGHRAASGSGYAVDDKPRMKFVGYERDSESSLDFVQARYYSANQGRFTSVDPLNPVIDYASDRAFYKFIAQPQNWNGYAFNRNNPLKYVDRDGRHPAVAGAVIGFFVGAGIELVKQAITLQPGQSADWGKIIGAGARGAIVGGVAGATGGLPLVPYVFASAGANIVGGAAGRATEVVTNNVVLDWKPEAVENIDDYALDMDSMVVDGIAGATGGLAGKFAESQVIRPAAQRYLNNSAYNRGVQTLRNIDDKSDKQVGRAVETVQNGFNNFFWWVNQARDKVRAAGTAGATAAAKKYTPIDCDNPGSGCKSDVRVVE